MKDIIIVDKEKVIAFKPRGLDVYSQEYIEEIGKRNKETRKNNERQNSN